MHASQAHCTEQICVEITKNIRFYVLMVDANSYIKQGCVTAAQVLTIDASVQCRGGVLRLWIVRMNS